MRKERNSRAIAVNKFELNTEYNSISGYQEEYSAIVCPGPPGSGVHGSARGHRPCSVLRSALAKGALYGRVTASIYQDQ